MGQILFLYPKYGHLELAGNSVMSVRRGLAGIENSDRWLEIYKAVVDKTLSEQSKHHITMLRIGKFTRNEELGPKVKRKDCKIEELLSRSIQL